MSGSTRIALVQEDKVRVRDDRLEVYHELFTHDAPNYLTAIYGYLQMMQGQELPREKTQRYIDTSIRQVEALNHLIDTTRNIRQMENAPQGMMVPLDLGAMVGQAISSVQGSSGGKAVDIRNEVPLGAHRAMVEEKLGEVFRIIINNAVAYSERPVVNVSIEDSGSNWNLRFRDNGRGIPDDKKEFLFLRFHRLDKDKKIRGSGLSLSLAKVLVERQGGRIWVENAVPGDHTKGSVFVVSLPKA
jgi:signal transduction histidine kinase